MVVVDADFFSSFFKIGKLSLILKAVNDDKIIIPSTVFSELKEAYFYEDAKGLFAFSKEELTGEKFVLVENIDVAELLKYIDAKKMEPLGDGEKGCLLVAIKIKDIIFTDDRFAGRVAKKYGLKVATIPTFLMRCRVKNILSREEIGQIINELKEKDNYKLSDEVKKLLLG